MKNKIIALIGMVLLSLSLLFTGCGSGKEENTTTENTTESVTEVTTDETTQSEDEEETVDYSAIPLEDRIGFYVDGSTLYDANGNPFVMRGINHGFAWFTDKSLVAFDAIAATGSNCVRIVISDGEQYNKTAEKVISALITLCKERNLIAVFEVHDATGLSDFTSLDKAAEYFVEVKNAFMGQEDYAIINIANEWSGSSKTWMMGYASAVNKLREAGLANAIMVDCGGWGQDGKCINNYGEYILEEDPIHNVIFSIHMYGTAGGSEESIRTNLGYALDQNLCVVVGEFGYKHTDGDVKEDYLMQYCEDYSIGYMAWSWKGNGGVGYLDLAKDWEGKTLSEDWGEVVVNGPNGIRETSKICTVYE